MRRGEVWCVDLDPARTGEANKVRPCVLVSNDANNVMARRLGRGVVTVVPVTSNTGRVFAFQIVIPAGVAGLNRDSKIQAEQIRAVSVDRLTERIGTLTAELRRELDAALRVQLAL
ncbi:MAG: type II toxin-antitoxin system PemK/MazF family toxin [Ilumatobacteraceae bacterium]